MCIIFFFFLLPKIACEHGGGRIVIKPRRRCWNQQRDPLVTSSDFDQLTSLSAQFPVVSHDPPFSGRRGCAAKCDLHSSPSFCVIQTEILPMLRRRRQLPETCSDGRKLSGPLMFTVFWKDQPPRQDRASWHRRAQCPVGREWATNTQTQRKDLSEVTTT